MSVETQNVTIINAAPVESVVPASAAQVEPVAVEPQASSADGQAPLPIQFSDSAAKRVHQLINEEENPNLKLRVYVTGGGCSGFQYGFTFEETVNEDDTQVTKDNVTLLIDPMSLQYLTGSEIDYQDNVQGSQFVIRNPNATTTCGCGSSFSV